MAVRTKLTSQGQVSIPAKIRKKLCVGPGSSIEWDDSGAQVVVRRAGRYTLQDVHDALFSKPPKPKTLEELREGPAKYVKEQHARGRY